MKKGTLIKCRHCGTIFDIRVFAHMRDCECGAIGYDSMEGTDKVRIYFRNKKDIIYL